MFIATRAAVTIKLRRSGMDSCSVGQGRRFRAAPTELGRIFGVVVIVRLLRAPRAKLKSRRDGLIIAQGRRRARPVRTERRPGLRRPLIIFLPPTARNERGEG